MMSSGAHVHRTCLWNAGYMCDLVWNKNCMIKWSGQSSICLSLQSLKQLVLAVWSLAVSRQAAMPRMDLLCCLQLWGAGVIGTAPAFPLVCQVSLSPWGLCCSEETPTCELKPPCSASCPLCIEHWPRSSALCGSWQNWVLLGFRNQVCVCKPDQPGGGCGTSYWRISPYIYTDKV